MLVNNLAVSPQPSRECGGAAWNRGEPLSCERSIIVNFFEIFGEGIVEEAIGRMVDKRLKRLPVGDIDERFKGMISRESLLRNGFGEAA
jgi:CBS domain-containing protein